MVLVDASSCAALCKLEGRELSAQRLLEENLQPADGDGRAYKRVLPGILDGLLARNIVEALPQ